MCPMAPQLEKMTGRKGKFDCDCTCSLPASHKQSFFAGNISIGEADKKVASCSGKSPPPVQPPQPLCPHVIVAAHAPLCTLPDLYSTTCSLPVHTCSYSCNLPDLCCTRACHPWPACLTPPHTFLNPCSTHFSPPQSFSILLHATYTSWSMQIFLYIAVHPYVLLLTHVSFPCTLPNPHSIFGASYQFLSGLRGCTCCYAHFPMS